MRFSDFFSCVTVAACSAAATRVITSVFLRLPLGAYFRIYFHIALEAVKSRSEVKW